MHYFLGTLALLGLGLIGLLIETHKQDKATIKDWRSSYERVVKENADWYSANKALRQANETLAANQKPVPWNKGKKYTLPRGADGKTLRKQTTYVLSDAPVLAAWDKDGNQTVKPEWMEEGHRSAGSL